MLGAYAAETAYDMIGAMLEDPFDMKVDRLEKEIHILGKTILDYLIMMKLYREGYLFYQFEKWHGKDMIISDFSVLKEAL